MEFIFAHHAPEFPERKQRNKSAEHYNDAAGQLIDAKVAGGLMTFITVLSNGAGSRIERGIRLIQFEP